MVEQWHTQVGTHVIMCSGTCNWGLVFFLTFCLLLSISLCPNKTKKVNMTTGISGFVVQALSLSNDAVGNKKINKDNLNVIIWCHFITNFTMDYFSTRVHCHWLPERRGTEFHWVMKSTESKLPGLRLPACTTNNDETGKSQSQIKGDSFSILLSSEGGDQQA